MRYLLFAGSIYYAAGGFNDFRGSFEHLQAAMKEGEKIAGAYNWYHVVDIEDNYRIVAGTIDQAHC